MRALSILLLLTQISPAQKLLLRQPTLNQTHIVFSFANDLWTVPKDGGAATRLTSGVGTESTPIFSPDGAQIAFTREYDGNVDVFTIPATGGTPKRLTYHPAPDTAIGWSPDGKSILFASPRTSYSGFTRLFTIPADGGPETQLPLDRAVHGSFSPDSSKIAYVPTDQWQRAWKRYRGGQTTPIWLANLSDSSITKIPRNNSNDSNPIWLADTVYFLSDRNGPVTLFAYNTKSAQVTEIVKNTGLDIKNASAGPGAIIYEQFGQIHIYDLKTRKPRPIDIRVTADLPELRPRFRKITPNEIRSAAISPTGARAVLAAHGEILTVPADKGDIRNITTAPASNEREPAWSPDGKSIAYFSDAAGEYALEIRDQHATAAPRRLSLGAPTFPHTPVWSPDSKKIAYTDKSLKLNFIDVEKATPPVHVDTDTYAGPMKMSPAWSPDSQWLAYTRKLKSHLHAVFLYSVQQNKTFQITDGMSDAADARFDKDGKYLYFTASTNTALTSGWLDMSSIERPVTRSVYITVLAGNLPSPLAPESDEEKPETPKEATKNDTTVSVTIDLTNISQRILALPIPARNYVALEAGKPGVLFLVEAPSNGEGNTLHHFDLKTRKTEKLRDAIRTFALSANGEKMLYRQGQQFFLTPATKAPPTAGPLRLDALQVWTNPPAEWRHMYHQAWRNQRDFFYDPGLHGVNRADFEKKYESYLDGLASRADLNYLFEEVFGELSVGHMFIGGGDRPDVKRVPTGLLGADYTVENGRYRFARVYNGENWNPTLTAPLTQPGVNVVAGEYLLAVQGRDVRPPANVYSFFEETVGKAITLRVGPDPNGANARNVTVVPALSENGLRNYAWIEDNRRKVDQLTGGRVGYVYLPNTAGGGYTNFNRYFFSQVGKDAVIIDERFNGGGSIADYVIDYLRRPVMGRFTMREGEDITVPMAGIFGPKVMIINEMAGSGGDAMPWLFRKSGLGPLVGTRTWGGLVGHYTGPNDLIDGGGVSTPNLAFYNLDGAWDVENRGVAPDIEVEMNPKLVRENHDPQLEKAVEVVMEQLRRSPVNLGKRPAYPDYQKK
jgi:tricorn protease